MRNFLAFIRRFRVLLLFVFLQGIALAIHISSLSFPRSQFLTGTSYLSGTLLEWKHGVTEFMHLREDNTSLQKENAFLRMHTIQSLMRLDNGNVKVDDTLYMVQYEYIPTKIINSTFTRRNNFFTLDVGTEQGVQRGMGVFSSDGVIGTVHYAGTKYSIVKSCLTEKVGIAVMLVESGEPGFLYWDGKDSRRGTLTGITNDSKIKKWSNVVTRGSAGIFPEGLPVGKVEKYKVVEGQPLWDITIIFSENYRTVQRAYVVKNLLKEEQNDAESHIPPDVEL